LPSQPPSLIIGRTGKATSLRGRLSSNVKPRNEAPLLSFLPLSQAPELAPQVEAWLLSEWPAWYGPGGAGSLRSDIAAFSATSVKLPIGVIALQNEKPVAFGALKSESISTHTPLAPWAAAGYVKPELRGQGIGAALLGALVTQARRLGYESVYCGTSTAENLLRRAGWQAVEKVVYAGKPLVIFRSVA
jgi:GNAT superfamily N-acetyltransferase